MKNKLNFSNIKRYLALVFISICMVLSVFALADPGGTPSPWDIAIDEPYPYGGNFPQGLYYPSRNCSHLDVHYSHGTDPLIAVDCFCSQGSFITGPAIYVHWCCWSSNWVYEKTEFGYTTQYVGDYQRAYSEPGYCYFSDGGYSSGYGQGAGYLAWGDPSVPPYSSSPYYDNFWCVLAPTPPHWAHYYGCVETAPSGGGSGN